MVESLLAIPDAAGGGKVAIERLDYQTAWGLSRAMVLHSGGEPYAIGFEFHDDIVELNGSDSPDKAFFYQVKTDKTKDWTLNRIAARKKVKGVHTPSFAWRMFENRKKFGAVAQRLVFVSNQPCPALGNDHNDYSFTAAPKKDLDAFLKSLQAEDGSFKEEHLSLFSFSYSPFNLGSFDKALLGEVTTFIHYETGLDNIGPKAFALMLVDQCRRRSKQLSNISDFPALLKSKFVTRADMERWLKELKDKNENRVQWSEIAGWFGSITEAQAIKPHFVAYDIERKSRLGAAALKFQGDVKKLVVPHMEKGKPLMEMLDAALPKVRKIASNWFTDGLQSDDYLRAIMLYEYCYVG
ncbi:dsDNA nuclease domain-containing protein [Mesorhizobium sp.]|uniref:dsDNA nuclease domain-containing protein n=1 Tax=Mesorhizobium sp. TaxID=1871066 RepID=UPI0025CE072F|nr:dsDNA nuclease domain-containing protein [Mesorhizobium sp.]